MADLIALYKNDKLNKIHIYDKSDMTVEYVNPLDVQEYLRSGGKVKNLGLLGGILMHVNSFFVNSLDGDYVTKDYVANIRCVVGFGIHLTYYKDNKKWDFTLFTERSTGYGSMMACLSLFDNKIYSICVEDFRSVFLLPMEDGVYVYIKGVLTYKITNPSMNVAEAYDIAKRKRELLLI